MNILCQIIIAATLTGVHAFPTVKLEEKDAVDERLASRNSGLSKRVTRVLQNKVFFTSFLEPITKAKEHDSIFLECSAAGSPPPTIHWLKDGVKIKQVAHPHFHDDEAAYERFSSSSDEKRLKLGGTASRLHLGCLTFDDEGTYSCIADTPYERITQDTFVKVRRNSRKDNGIENKCSKNSEETNVIEDVVEEAKITMWSTRRLEVQGADVQLFCRASGSPTPKITWRDRSGKKIRRHRRGYKLLRNGDLLIKNISWRRHMGMYRCKAENSEGTDMQTTFLYPTAA